MELSSPKIKKFQEGTFRARQIKKTTLKKFLIIREMELSSPRFRKNSYISGGSFKVTSLKKILIFFLFLKKKKIYHIFLFVYKYTPIHFSS